MRILLVGLMICMAVVAIYWWGEYELRREYSWSATALNAGVAADTTSRTIYFTGLGPQDSLGRQDVANPERGFRTEILMDLADLTPAFNDRGQTRYRSDFSQILEQNASSFQGKQDQIKLTQLYLYLDSTLIGKPIPEEQLQNLNLILEEVREAGFKAILRFAYQKQAKPTAECSAVNSISSHAPMVQVRHIQQHLRQLSPVLAQHAGVIHAVQAGFVGAWGEWHNDFYGHPCSADSVRAVLQAVLQAVPPHRKMMVREPSLKRVANLLQNNRVGYHNDYFVLEQGPHKYSDYSRGRKGISKHRRAFEKSDFQQVLQEGFTTVVDGEMPYDGVGDAWNLNQVLPDDYAFAKRLREHGYTSFSVVHNYATNIKAWKDKFVTASQLRKDKAPVTDGYFLNHNGKEVPRSLYEYIRDHLGYRLQLVSATLPRTLHRAMQARVHVKLKNFGFAAPVNPRNAYLVLIGPKGEVHSFKTNADLQNWYPANKTKAPEHTLAFDLPVAGNVEPGQYQVGLWLPDAAETLKHNAAYAIKLPNKGVRWWVDPAQRYLVNVFATVQVQQGLVLACF
ncbi:MAG: DUF4832 domain-containing protein [Rufibacter sp.]